MPTTTNNTLRAELAAYLAAVQAILTNGELTQEAKLKRVAALKEQALASITKTGDLLWRGLESDFKTAEAALRRARQEANSGWDFGRLAYEAGAVPSLLSNVRSIEEIGKLYDSIKATGDPYKLRAFRDYVPTMIMARQYPSDEGTGGLLATLKRDAEESATTPAVKRAEANAAALIDLILAAKAATIAVVNEFGLDQSFAAPSTLNPMVLWLRRLRIEAETLPNDPLKQVVKVEFAEPEVNKVRKFVE